MDLTNTFSKVSIIIPTYNRANLILETIESIIQQTYPHWELLIMDDGSDDDTEEMIKRINDPRIRFHQLERTGIVSGLRNKGIRLSQFELIAFADSDDLWASTKLEKQILAFKQYPEAGFSLTGGYNFKIPGEPLEYFYRQKEGIRTGNIFTAFFNSEIAAHTSGLLFKKRCIDSCGYLDESKPFSDPDFIVALASFFEAAILFEPLVYRRLHERNDNNENWEKRFNEWVDVINRYRNNKKLPARTARNALFRLYINFGERYLREKKRKEAIGKFLKAWKNKPTSIVPLKKSVKSVLHYFKTGFLL